MDGAAPFTPTSSRIAFFSNLRTPTPFKDAMKEIEKKSGRLSHMVNTRNTE